MNKFGHLFLHLFALQLLLQRNLEARHWGRPLGVFLVGLRKEETVRQTQQRTARCCSILCENEWQPVSQKLCEMNVWLTLACQGGHVSCVCASISHVCVLCVCFLCLWSVQHSVRIVMWGARFIQDSRSDAGNVTSSMTGRKQNSSKGRWQEETGVGFHSIQNGLEPMETENYRRNADMFVGRQSIVPQRTSAYWNWILSFVERWEK